MIRSTLMFATSLALRLALAACSSTGGNPPVAAPSGVVKGTVTYRERIALPPDAVVDLWIVDASPGIVIAAIFGEVSVPTEGRQVPIPFELRYDPTRVVPDHDYQIKAVIRAGGRTLFETQEKHPVITKGAPSELELMMLPAP